MKGFIVVVMAVVIGFAFTGISFAQGAGAPVRIENPPVVPSEDMGSNKNDDLKKEESKAEKKSETQNKDQKASTQIPDVPPAN